MKKLFLVLLVLTVFFISCDNDVMENKNNDVDLFEGDNPFLGTWDCLRVGRPALFVFTETEIRRHGKDETGNYRIIPDTIWTYEFTDTELKTLEYSIDNGIYWAGYGTINPYNFSVNRNFIFDQEELKKISKKTSFP